MSEPESPPADDGTEALLTRLAAQIVERRMSMPAILFLESYRPLHFVGAQALGAFEPLLRSLFPWNDLEKLRVALEKRGTLERLIQNIEAAEARHTRGGGEGQP